MLWLKGCPRCKTGDLFEASDIHGPYIACLQCGYYLSPAEEGVLRGFGPGQLRLCHQQPVGQEAAAMAQAA